MIDGRLRTRPARRRLLRWAAALPLAVLAGCALVRAPTPRGLADTAWALRSIQSMDSRQGTTRVDDPSRFTLRFQADGRAALRLDCNRATASWEAAPAADGTTGALRFGPVAGTRALCAPPGLDERVVRDLPFVRGYRLLDGRLYLSLMADGGVYEFEPFRDPP